MNWKTVLLGLALALAGCSLYGVRTFGISYPAPDGVGGLTVQMTDHTRLVDIIDAAPANAVPFPEGLQVVPGRPNMLSLTWLGGVCDTGVEITLRQEQALTLQLTTSRRQGGCRLAGITRSIFITFTRPIDPATVTVLIEP